MAWLAWPFPTALIGEFKFIPLQQIFIQATEGDQWVYITGIY